MVACTMPRDFPPKLAGENFRDHMLEPSSQTQQAKRLQKEQGFGGFGFVSVESEISVAMCSEHSASSTYASTFSRDVPLGGAWWLSCSDGQNLEERISATIALAESLRSKISDSFHALNTLNCLQNGQAFS